MTAKPRRTSTRIVLALGLAMLHVVAIPALHAFSIRPHRGGHAEQLVIEQLEDQIRLALLAGDAPSLDKILADDFLGISANGTLSDKQQYLRRVGKHEHQFSRIDVVDRKVRIQPSSAIVVTTAEVVGTLENTPVNGTFRYTRVYSREINGAWKLRNFEATRVSGQVVDELRRGTPVSRIPSASKSGSK